MERGQPATVGDVNDEPFCTGGGPATVGAGTAGTGIGAGMDSRPSGARVVAPGKNTASAAILRLLPHVQHPPARVLVLGGPGDLSALDARGYRVEAGDVSFIGAENDGVFDLICEGGVFGQVPPESYLAAAASHLRSGGRLFGGFTGVSASHLIHTASRHFEVERLETSSTEVDGVAVLEAVLRRR